jgi:hypothetical protein
VGLLQRGISPLQGLYLCTKEHKHRINAHRHPCLEWDLNSRPQCSSGGRLFHALDRAAIVIAEVTLRWFTILWEYSSRSLSCATKLDLNFIYVSVQISNIVLLVCFKLITFLFQIFHLSSTSFKSHTFKLSPFYSHFICLWLYSPYGPWPLFQFLNPYAVCRTPWTGDQPVARPLPTHRINAHRHPCLEWDSNPPSQCWSLRRRLLDRAAAVIGFEAIAITQAMEPHRVCGTSRIPHFLDSRHTSGGEVVSLARRPPFAPQEDSWYSFLLEAESTPGP